MRAGHIAADLLVLTTHGESHEDHTSITEQLLDRAQCEVLALHDASVDHAVPHFASPDVGTRKILAPVSFSDTSASALELSFDPARTLPLEVHLLHVEPARASIDEPVSAPADEDRRRMMELVPEDFAERVRLHVTAGDPAREISAMAERLGASLVVMGEHTRAPLRRWFTRDTGRSVLHHAHCPVWYVP